MYYNIDTDQKEIYYGIMLYIHTYINEHNMYRRILYTVIIIHTYKEFGNIIFDPSF